MSCGDFARFENFRPPEDRTVTRVIRDDANAEFIRQFTRNCPKCNNKILKESGCNHMRCPCGAYFCWRCKYVYKHDHEGHYCQNETQNEGEAVTEHVVKSIDYESQAIRHGAAEINLTKKNSKKKYWRFYQRKKNREKHVTNLIKHKTKFLRVPDNRD